MTGKTHTTAGLLAGELVAIASQQTDPTPIAMMIGLGILGGILPDIDHKTSTISQSSGSMRLLSSIVTLLTKHRGITHTLVFAFLSTIGMYFLLGKLCAIAAVNVNLGFMALAFLAGIISHLLADSLNPTGIMWLWPVSSHRFHVAAIKTGSKKDETFRIILNVLATLCLTKILYYSMSLEIPGRFYQAKTVISELLSMPTV